MLMIKLIERILKDYGLPPDGIHGIGHWGRVLENGRKLAHDTGGDLKVVSLFAVLHDSKRENEGHDFLHGSKASLFIDEIRNEYLDITDDQLYILKNACTFHNQDLIQPQMFNLYGADDEQFQKAIITIQTCWDADRLDLPRVGIVIDPERLCTEAAKKSNIIEWGTQRAKEEVSSDFIWEVVI